MKSAIVAATLFQLYNAIKIAFDMKRENYSMDLYLQCYSNDVKTIGNNLKKADLFTNVYFWNNNFKRDRFEDILIRTQIVNNPRIALTKIAIESDYDHPSDYYDVITYTVGNYMELILASLNRNAKIIGYDDGTGSYIRDQYHYDRGRLWKLIKGERVFNNRELNCLYLNNPDMCLYHPSYDILPIPSMDTFSTNQKEFLNSVFNYKEAHDSVKGYFLTTPYEEIGLDYSRVLEVDQVIYKYSKDIIVRNHPRENRKKEPNIVYDTTDSMWEIKCEREISEDSILISYFSTAQITPKLLYNSEPYLVFLYKLFNNSNRDLYDSMVKLLLQNYKCSDKIYSPENVEELIIVLDKLLYSINE